MKKIILMVLSVFILGAGGGLVYLYAAFPDVAPAPHIRVEGTSQQIERGKYLAIHVAVCIDCHSTRDWSRFSGPVKTGTYGKGGEIFNEDMGFPGTFYSRNITPYNLKGWSDGEIYRAITTGVTKDGDVLFPVMPYLYYARMAPGDVKAIIAYLRTLKPIAYEAPESEPNFPLNLIMRTIPEDAKPMEPPSADSPVDYGKYLTTIAGCSECHTPQKQGAAIEGMFLAGGFEFKMPFGTIRSANLTPDKQTGIGNWSKEQFVQHFKQYDLPADSLQQVAPGRFNSVMPWKMYGGMKRQDLEAIYDFLQSVRPVKNKVVKFTPRPTAVASK